MNDIVSWLISVGNQLGNWNYLILTAIAFLEALPIAGFFIPGVIALLLGGFLAAQGLINFSQLLVLVSLGSFLGDLVAFGIGRRFGKSFTSEHRILKKVYLVAAERFMERWGKTSLIIGRFISSVRSMVNVVSGAAGITWTTFGYRAAIGSLLFSFIYIGLGYIAGSAWESVSSWSSRAATLIASAVAILIFIGWLKGFIVKQGRELKKIAASVIASLYASIEKELTPFWRRRLSPGNFFGLPIFSLAAVIIILIVVIFWLGFSATNGGSLWFDLDQRVITFIELFSNNHIAIGAFLITTLGSLGFIVVAGTVLTFWLLFEKRHSYVIGLWLAIGGSLVSSTLIKLLLARPRPMPIFYFENSYAFPSSHAALSLIFFIFLAYYAVRAYPRWSRNVSAIFIAAVIAIAVGFSRIYLGVHYLSDVLGGLALGGIWLIGGIIVQRALQRLDNPQRLPKMQQTVLLVGIIILVGAVYFTKFFDKNAIQDLYRFEPASVHESITLQKALSLKALPLYTENLRGGRERPIEYIFKSNEATLRQSLRQAGWLERRPPTIATVLHRGSAIVFNTPYPDAPLRPRFWNNKPNELSFTKLVPDSDMLYTLRLWRSEFTDAATDVFVGELWIGRDLSFGTNQFTDFLSVGGQQLVTDLSATSAFIHQETMVPEENIKITVILLR